MKNKTQIVILLVSALAVCAVTATAETETHPDMTQTLEIIRKKHDLPALAVVVVKDGGICDRIAVGVRKLGDSTPVTTNDLFHIGSCTKSMTATLTDEAKLGDVLKAASRLRIINGDLATASAKAESLLGPVWSRGEPQLEHLIQVRAWGATLHERLAMLCGDEVGWLAQLRVLIGDLFRQGPASFETGTNVGNRLNRYRDVITQFDAAYEPLSESATIDRGPLDKAEDHLSAVFITFGQFQKNAPRLRGINHELELAAATAEACLGILWEKGEPNDEAISKARAWGESLHSPRSPWRARRRLAGHSQREHLASMRPPPTPATGTPFPSASPPRDPGLHPTDNISPARRVVAAAH